LKAIERDQTGDSVTLRYPGKYRSWNASDE